MSLSRLAPLSGIVFVVVTTSVFTIGGSTPGMKDSKTKIADFYSTHHSKHETLAWVLMIAVGFLAIFTASAWALLSDMSRVWAALFLVGGIVAAGGFLIAAAIHLALAEGAHHALDPAALQALNALDADDYLPFGAGIAIMTLGGAGAMIPQSGALRVLGWIALVLGIVAFTPAGFFAFLGSGLWVIAVSIVLFMRAGEGAAPPAAIPSAAG